MTRTDQIHNQIEFVKDLQSRETDVEFRKAYDSTIDNLEIMIANINVEDEYNEVFGESEWKPISMAKAKAQMEHDYIHNIDMSGATDGDR